VVQSPSPVHTLFVVYCQYGKCRLCFALTSHVNPAARVPVLNALFYYGVTHIARVTSLFENDAYPMQELDQEVTP
jgi:hypothetical protein